jgi:hypothetical protein
MFGDDDFLTTFQPRFDLWEIVAQISHWEEIGR